MEKKIAHDLTLPSRVFLEAEKDSDRVKTSAVDFTTSKDSSYLELGRVPRPNLGLILRSACYSAGLGLVLSLKISLKLGRVL